jgi:2-polyprenyl-6-methoxyphenol hydroxylase-like FAD-dependent oxidoreductase
MSQRESRRVPVVIAGGGPVGMVAALELARRGIASVLLNDRPDTAAHPKANAFSARTMEHFRRLGFADRVRRAGLPADYPTDVTYHTRLAGYELARVPMPSWSEAVAEAACGKSPWESPEPAHRVSQIYVERELRKRLAEYPCCEQLFGWRLDQFREETDGVLCNTRHEASGRTLSFRASYLLGCDGGQSTVRRQLGIEFEGDGRIIRPFMGGSMLGVFFRASRTRSWLRPAPAWGYWVINPDIRAVLMTIDGDEHFVIHLALPQEGEPGSIDVLEMIYQAAGVRFPLQIISVERWTAGYRLISQRYGGGRVYMAGDAVHLFTPTGGMGVNTGIDDAVNLAWKVAAMLQGWGGPHLLASYEADRRPIGLRNLAFSKALADGIGAMPATPNLEATTPEGAAARAAQAPHLCEYGRHEFIIPGTFLGVVYEGSPIIVPDGTPAPPDDQHRYVPVARPGSRAPHCWLGDGDALYDHFGTGFTLLDFVPASERIGAFRQAFERKQVPMKVLPVGDERARELYGRDYVLVGPDQHVVWRSNDLPPDPDRLVDVIRGTAGLVDAGLPR